MLAKCPTLDAEQLSLPGLKLTEASSASAKADGSESENYPEHCLLRGALDERTGIDGQAYAIGFELRLPRKWNRRFYFQGGGGTDGAINPALGKLAVNVPGNALSQGFAVVSTDAGHTSEQAPPFIGGATFGLDPQARVDYGYRAVGAVTDTAKKLIERVYASKIERSYFVGCSNGGRQALVAAARFSNQFDGIIAGDPGFELPKAAVQHAWDFQQLISVDRDKPENAFTTEEMRFVSSRILDRCDARDGATDGIVADMKGCGGAFDLERDVAECKGSERTGTCLTAGQKKALAAMVHGPVNSQKEALYSDWPWDPGIGAESMAGWRGWKLGLPSMGGFSLISTLGASSLAYVFTTPPTDLRPGLTGDPTPVLHDFLAKFDFDRDAPKISATTEVFTESSVSFMIPPDATRLPGLAQGKTKLLVYHGTADPVFSSNATQRWYEALQSNVPNASSFARLYLVPGMCHCNGGPATDAFDLTTALFDWVEHDKAPRELIAHVASGNMDTPAKWSATRTRPLCVFPAQARLKPNATDLEAADSFECHED